MTWHIYSSLIICGEGGGYKRQHFRPISEMRHTVFPRMSARGAHLIGGLRGRGAHSREAHLNIYPQRGGHSRGAYSRCGLSFEEIRYCLQPI